jgi:hypothetical protein
VSEHPPAPDSDDLVFRRGKLRKRDDPAIELFREALGHLEDLPRVRRIGLELSRLYDPVLNRSILEPGIHRAVVGHLEAGRHEEARSLLEAALAEYTRPNQPAPGPGGPPGTPEIAPGDRPPRKLP